MPMPQMGQLVLPSSSARLMARLLVRCHLAVLVLDNASPPLARARVRVYRLGYGNDCCYRR